MRSVFFCLVLIAVAAALPRLTPAPGRIRFATTQLDFGTVPHGSIVKRTFDFENVGGRPIVVAEVKPSCGCTAAEPSVRRLEPGQRGHIEVAFDTAKKPVHGGRQRFRNTVRFVTQEQGATGRPTVTEIVLDGEVVARYRLIPEIGLIFSNPPQPDGVAPAAPPAVSVEVLPAREAIPGDAAPPPPLEIREGGARIASVPPAIEVLAFEAVERDGSRGVLLRAAIRADTPPGTVDGEVAIETGNPAQPRVVVPVRGFVPPPVRAEPPRIVVVRDGTAQERAPRPLRVRATRPVAILHAAVVSADGAPPAFEVASGPDADTLIVRPREGGDFGLVEGSAGDVLIFFADARTPVLKVPYLLRDPVPAATASAQRLGGIRVSPPDILLAEVMPDRVTEVNAIVSHIDGPPLAITDLAVDPPGALEVRVDMIAPDKVARLAIRPSVAAPGAFTARIAFRPHPGGEPLGIRVAGRVLSRLVAAPEGLVARGEAWASLVLRRRDGAPLEVLAAESSTGRHHITIEPLPDGAVRVAARLLPGLPPVAQPTLSQVRIRTGLPGEEVTRLPLLETTATP